MFPRIKQSLNAHMRLCRLDKPIGGLLLYYPCVWGSVLGQEVFNLPEILHYGVVFGVGAMAMRSAGCIVNDMFDRDIDGKVERTRSRPLASGEIGMTGAAVTLGVNLGLGLCVLTQLSWTTVAASFAIVPVAFLYPLAKRYFKYPQLILGFNFNWGVIVGAIQTGGVLSPAVLICYTAAVLHTLIYDTIYAHQDIKFDKQLGLYSTAYTLPHNTPLYLTFPFTVLLAASCMSAGYSAITIPLLAAMQVALFRQIRDLDFSDPVQCGNFFRKFQYYQLTLCVILGLGSYLRD